MTAHRVRGTVDLHSWPLTWILYVDADAVVEQAIGAVNIEVGDPLLLYDSVLLDYECLGIPSDANLAAGSRVKVVDLLPSLVANLGAGIGGLSGPGHEGVKNAIVRGMLRL